MIRKLFPLYGSPAPRVVPLGGTFTIGAGGAVASQTGAKLSGATVTQVANEDGRYAIAFSRTFKRILSANAFYVGADDAAFPTTTGSLCGGRLLTPSGFSVQAIRTDTNADTDPASGATYCWSALVATV